MSHDRSCIDRGTSLHFHPEQSHCPTVQSIRALRAQERDMAAKKTKKKKTIAKRVKSVLKKAVGKAKAATRSAKKTVRKAAAGKAAPKKAKATRKAKTKAKKGGMFARAISDIADIIAAPIGKTE
ncbi:MAG TPA: hypothetical protein VGC36_12035 [Rhizomicrobium sp.]